MNSANTLPHTRFLAVATAGHVDHGKTSLVRHLTGTDTDTLAEEKARGLTINTGFAYRHFTLADRSRATLGFVDVPGHSDFINNMLAGVSAVGAALLVVAADDGIMPQTREHLAILDLLGLSRGVIALTKIDRVDAEALAAVRAELLALLADTSLADAKIIEVDNLSGDGIAELATHLESWVDDQNSAQAAMQQRPRFLIDRAFSAKGIGTLVTGTVVAGTFASGEDYLHSSGSEAKVRGIRVDHDERTYALAGQRAALNVSLSHEAVERGDWLGVEAAPVQRMDAELRLLALSRGDTPPIKPGVDYHLHIGASHRLARLRLLQNAGARSTAASAATPSPAQPREHLYQLSLDAPLSCYWGDRFILRDPSARQTLGGGRIIDTAVPRRARASDERLALLNAHCAPTADALEGLIELSRFGVSVTQFANARNLADSAVDALLVALRGTDTAPLELATKNQRWPLLFSRAHFNALTHETKAAIASFHAAMPSATGCDEREVLRRFSRQLAPNPKLLNALLDGLVVDGVLRRGGTLYALPSHKAQISKEREEFDAVIAPLLRKGATTPPRTREIVDATGIPLKAVERILQHVAREGAAVRVADNRYYLPATLTTLAQLAEQLMGRSEAEGFSVIEFRDATQMGRNLCIEVLEHFDAVGFTLRKDNLRIVRRPW